MSKRPAAVTMHQSLTEPRNMVGAGSKGNPSPKTLHAPLPQLPGRGESMRDLGKGVVKSSRGGRERRAECRAGRAVLAAVEQQGMLLGVRH